MTVKCVVNTIEEALVRGLQSYAIEEHFHYEKSFPLLGKGNEYYVYGILLTSNGIWVFILEDKDDDYPKQYPMSLFEITDSYIPKDWVTGKGEEFFSASRKVFALLTHNIWAGNRMFYENLVDGRKQALAEFKLAFKSIGS